MGTVAALLASVSACAFILTRISIAYVKRVGMLDVPGERHSHTETTPRGGGLGIVLTLLAASFLWPLPVSLPEFWFRCLMPGFVSLVIVSFVDDHMSLSARLRFSVQLAASLYLLFCLHSSGWSPFFGWWFMACVYVVWMTNLFNFMDGSNGMAGGQAVFAGLVAAVLFAFTGNDSAAWLSGLLAAASLGFLPWNLGKARVFMGDVGSIPIGFLIAGLLVYGVLNRDFSISVAWLVMVVFFSDSTLTLLGRVMRREQWYTPHKQHLYQRLIVNGWTHGQVLLLYQLINLLLVVPVIVVAVNFPEWAEVVAITTTCALAIAWFLALRKIGVLA